MTTQQAVDQMLTNSSASMAAKSNAVRDQLALLSTDTGGLLESYMAVLDNGLNKYAIPDMKSLDKISKLMGIPRNNDNVALSALGLFVVNGVTWKALPGSQNWKNYRTLYDLIGRNYPVTQGIISGQDGQVVLVRTNTSVVSAQFASEPSLVNVQQTFGDTSITSDQYSWFEPNKTLYLSRKTFVNLNTDQASRCTDLVTLGGVQFDYDRINNLLVRLHLDDERSYAVINGQNLESLTTTKITEAVNKMVIRTLTLKSWFTKSTIVKHDVLDTLYAIQADFETIYPLLMHRNIDIADVSLIDYLKIKLTDSEVESALQRDDLDGLDNSASDNDIFKYLTKLMSDDSTRSISSELRNPWISYKDEVRYQTLLLERLMGFLVDWFTYDVFVPNTSLLSQDQTGIHVCKEHGQEPSLYVSDVSAVIKQLDAFVSELSTLLIRVADSASSTSDVNRPTANSTFNTGFANLRTASLLIDDNVDWVRTFRLNWLLDRLDNMLIRETDGTYSDQYGVKVSAAGDSIVVGRLDYNASGLNPTFIKAVTGYVKSALENAVDIMRSVRDAISKFLSDIADMLTLSLNLQGKGEFEAGPLKCAIGFSWNPSIDLLALISKYLPGLVDILAAIFNAISAVMDAVSQVLCLPVCIIDSILNAGPQLLPGGLPFCKISFQLPPDLVNQFSDLQNLLRFSNNLFTLKKGNIFNNMVPSVTAMASGWDVDNIGSCDCATNEFMTGLGLNSLVGSLKIIDPFKTLTVDPFASIASRFE